jgi:hypothetical protein
MRIPFLVGQPQVLPLSRVVMWQGKYLIPGSAPAMIFFQKCAERSKPATSASSTSQPKSFATTVLPYHLLPTQPEM